VLPAFAAGNVFAGGAEPSRFDHDAVRHPAPIRPQLTQRPDGWYLTLTGDPGWSLAPRRVVTTDLLGVAHVPGLPYENTDGSPIEVGADYLHRQRETGNPYPGPFERPAARPIRVWPKQQDVKRR
jgi:alpha-N-arabinofuranosidase